MISYSAKFTLYALLLIALPSHANSPAASQQLSQLGDAFYFAQAKFDPITFATQVGDSRFDDQLNINISPVERSKYFASLHSIQKQLKVVSRRQLSNEDQLTYDVLNDELQATLGAEPFPDHLLPITQMDAMPITLANFGSGQAEQPLQTVANYDAYLKRLSKLPAWIDQAIINMREGMKQGIVEPRSVVIPMLAQLKGLNTPLNESPYYLPIKNFPALFSASDQQRLKVEYEKVVGQQVLPATRKLVEFVEKEYLPASRTTDGWSAMPNGKSWYQQWSRYHTTTSMTPDEIHQLGLKEVDRIHAELAKLAPQLGYNGDLKDLPTWLRTNPKFIVFKTDAEILNEYRAINEKVKLKLPSLFSRVPKAPLEIREEPELTRNAASDHYALPAEDGSRPGVFWAVITDPAAYNKSTMASLFLHEGQPGHHFQLAIQQELSLPQFRKRALIGAYIEGWALYAETLGHELGLYDDAGYYAGNLRLEMMRAVRLVVDTGMHAKGWSHDQAVKYFMENTGHSEEYARNQIERYIAWPGQALGYKLGALKIQALRDRAKQRLGNKFSLPAFHDAVLVEGPLPLSVLDSYIDRWIAAQQLH